MQVNNPGTQDFLISYKGHGQIESAGKTNSIGHVIAHENRHIRHYRDYAQFHGKEIVREDVSISYAFVDGKLTAVAGKATVAMRDKSEHPNFSTQEPVSAESSSTPDISTAGDETEKKKRLDILLSRVETALAKIDSRIEKANRSAQHIDQIDSAKISRLMQKRANLETKKKDIVSKKNTLDAEKLTEMVEDLLAGMIGLFDQAAGLIKANYALKAGKQNSGSVDKAYEVEVPDYSMLFTGIVVDTMI